MSESVFILFLLAIVAPFVAQIARGATGWLLALAPLSVAIFFASRLPAISAGKLPHETFRWVPSLSIALSFRMDGLSLLFALLILGMGVVVLVYSGGYFAGHKQIGRMYCLLLLFMASMLGLVLADNLLAMFVFWELTSITSYLLIGFNHASPQARAAALQALLITGSGGLALMAGLLLLGIGAGSMEISTLLNGVVDFRSHPHYVLALLLILAGAFTKSAQFPFHFWLPGAMEAPTPVSAYLHSATMVKAGIYVLARLSPILGGTEFWTYTISVVGGATMLLGAWLSVWQTDLKRILAYSTIGSLGTLTLLLGLGGERALFAAMAYLLGHALYKGSLFLVAGAVDHSTGTRDVRLLRGLKKAMPLTMLAAGIAAASMAGLPPTFGFIAKELSYEASLHMTSWGVNVLQSHGAELATGTAVVANVFLVAAAMLVGIRPFFGKENPELRDAHEGPLSLWLGPVLLAGIGLAFGLFPLAGADELVRVASSSILGKKVDSHLALWHGVNTALVLSVSTLALGVAVYMLRDRLMPLVMRASKYSGWGPARGYELALQGLNAAARWQTQLLQSGNLRFYLMITLVTVAALGGYSLLGRGPVTFNWNFSDIRFYDVGLVTLIFCAVVAAVLAKSRLSAITSLGVVGYGVALVFIMYGAPDLAMTQFLVETLTVILFVLVFFHLPEISIVSGPTSRTRDVLISAFVGVVIAAFVLLGSTEAQRSISEYFVEHSVPDGHGQNIVNVILVDFRGLDTMGEITVLAVAAIGVYGLLKLRRKGTGSSANDRVVFSEEITVDLPRETGRSISTSLILCTGTRFLLPLLLLFSFFLLFRGHNEPGGGFTGGLVAGAAFVLYRFAFGVEEVTRILPFEPRVVIGGGLLVALSSGVFGLLGGSPLMTGQWTELDFPGVGKLALGTPLLFDVGVYMVVMGVTLSIILPLAEE